MLDKLKIKNLYNNRGLFVFSDPGGAKPLMSLIENYGLVNYKIYSDRIYDFFLDFDVLVHNIGDSDDIEKIIINIGPRKKCGIEIKKILALMIILSINNMWFLAAITPPANPKINAIKSEVMANR